MSFTRSVAAVAVAAALAGFATPAQAQYSESSVWITPFAGAYFGGSFDPVSNTYSVNKLDVGTAFTFGARLGYKFNPSIGLVFEYAHGPELQKGGSGRRPSHLGSAGGPPRDRRPDNLPSPPVPPAGPEPT